MYSFAVLAALGASGCSATSSALQHRTAADVHVAPGPAPAAVLTATRATVTNRLWLIAVVLQGFGFLLHATALGLGQLIVVQPLLVCAVLFALPLNRLLHREPVTGRELGWAALVVAGLAGFLVTASPNAGLNDESATTGPAVLAIILGALAATVLLIAAARRGTRPEWRARLLAAAAGIFFTGQAALLKSAVDTLSQGILALFTSPQLYLLMVLGLAGILCCQLAFRAGPLATSLPVVNTVNPLLGVVVGAFVYHETVRHSPLALIAETLCLAVLVVATVALTRLAER